MTNGSNGENRGPSLDALANLGPKSTRMLTSAGITTVEQLRDLGPVFAFAAVKAHHPEATLNLLWAMAAGLQGRDWRSLAADEKELLREELKKLLQ